MQNSRNTDVVYQGMTFHVQTEDMGARSGYFQTEVYYRGKILWSRRHDYPPAEHGGEEIEDRIDRAHQDAVRRVARGEIDLTRVVPVLEPPPRSDKKSGKIKIVARAGRFMRSKRTSFFESAQAPSLEFRKVSGRRRSAMPVLGAVLAASAVLLLVVAAALPRIQTRDNPTERMERLLGRAADMESRGQGPAALEILDRLVARFPNEVRGLVERARLKARLFGPAEAAADLAAAVELAPNRADLRLELARAELAAGESDAAEQELRSALDIDQGLRPAYLLLGRVLADRGALEQAEETWRRAVERTGADADLLGRLGRLAVRRGAYGQAILDLEQALTLDPERIETYLQLGEVYLAAGDKDRAAELWTRAARMRPDDPRARRRLARLR